MLKTIWHDRMLWYYWNVVLYDILFLLDDIDSYHYHHWWFRYQFVTGHPLDMIPDDFLVLIFSFSTVKCVDVSTYLYPSIHQLLVPVIPAPFIVNNPILQSANTSNISGNKLECFKVTKTETATM